MYIIEHRETHVYTVTPYDSGLDHTVYRVVSRITRDFEYKNIVYVDQWLGRWTQADPQSPVVTNTSGNWEQLL